MPGECETGHCPSAHHAAKMPPTRITGGRARASSCRETGDVCVQSLEGFPQVEEQGKKRRHFTLKHSKNVTACDPGGIRTKGEQR